MDQKLLIGIGIGLVIGAVGGYFSAGIMNPAPITTATNSPSQQTQQAQAAVKAASNVQTNPYQNVKTNPFDY